MTTPFVVLDLVVNEEFCNLTCEYCLTGQSNYRRKGRAGGLVGRVKENMRDNLLAPSLESVARQGALMDIPVLKISGGEYLLMADAVESLRRMAADFETVVVMTNGLPLSGAMLSRLERIPNLVLQLSLDSTLFETNRYRIGSARLHALFIERLKLLCRSAVPFEVYLVINRNSIQTLNTTLVDIKSYGGDVPVFPFPVRGPERAKYLPDVMQLEELRELKENAVLRGMLPHEGYMEMLLEFCVRGRRMDRCHIPRAAFTAFGDGIVTSCPNIWFDEAANILNDGASGTVIKLERSPVRRGLLRRAASVELCRLCFTPWDIINLYLEGVIPRSELMRSPIFARPRALGKLDAIHDSLRKSFRV